MAAKNRTKAQAGEERFVATGKGLNVITPGGKNKNAKDDKAKAKTKAKTKKGGK